MENLRKYGQATTITFSLTDRGTLDFESTPVTFASGDTQISKDEGAFANTINNPTHEGNGIYSLALTATEMQAKRITLTLIDTATKEWEDKEVRIVTHGDASAQYKMDFDYDIDRVIDHIENLKGHHTHQGDSIYVGPTTGNDTTGDGSRELPYATVTKAHATATDNNHDTIHLLADNTAGITVLDEQVTLTKNYLFVRGPGRDFCWKSTSSGDVITNTGNGVELMGFCLETHISGSGDGISNTGDFLYAHDIFSDYTRGNAIYLEDCSWCTIDKVTFVSVGVSGSGHGIQLKANGGAVAYNRVTNCDIYNVQGDGIKFLIGTGTMEDNIVSGNLIQECAGYGINIGTSVEHTHIHSNGIHDNTSGTINDNGTETHATNNEQWLKESTLVTDVGTELSAVPDTAGTFMQKINYLFQYFRNKRKVTSSTETMYKEDGTTELGTAPLSDDGNTFTKGESS